MRYTSLFIGSAFLCISMNSLATVGGGQHIEFLGYEAKDQKLYLLRHFEDGRGRLPQLYYYQFSKHLRYPKLTQVNSLYVNKRTGLIDYDQQYKVLEPELNKIRRRLQPIQRITPKIFKIIINKQQQRTVPAIWVDPNIKVQQYHYQYQVASVWFGSQLQQAVSYKPELKVKQAFYIPQQNKVVLTTQYLAFPEETGYLNEDPVLLEVKTRR
ncbi:aminotransferase [Acinetobacter sp. CAAS 2-6]|uniref:aminotransferase n=1 Tax=Acinetobacter sp. CAAS 2-6 TaxID=3016358 RepID=UPI002DD68333|nr:aminotransferase [Acinetobacter sp. CAAS 2-6]